MGLTLAGVLVSSGVLAAPAAVAAELPEVTSTAGDHAPATITTDTIRRAIAEARAAGAIESERIDADGVRVVVIRASNGATMVLRESEDTARISAGSDSYGGTYVGFNAFDQNLIISGAMTAIAAGMCALGPAVCAVVNVAAVLASAAIGSSGGVQCGSKSLRVYPLSHKKPRCA